MTRELYHHIRTQTDEAGVAADSAVVALQTFTALLRELATTQVGASGIDIRFRELGVGSLTAALEYEIPTEDETHEDIAQLEQHLEDVYIEGGHFGICTDCAAWF
ncbi:MAG: hypothetical protein U5Q44_00015 [Dehalococcoidia bacterium]|nr:hypothetical protein [Dehalococcoidia bacterium]